jgi:hypothetical protein
MSIKVIGDRRVGIYPEPEYLTEVTNVEGARGRYFELHVLSKDLSSVATTTGIVQLETETIAVYPYVPALDCVLVACSSYTIHLSTDPGNWTLGINVDGSAYSTYSVPWATAALAPEYSAGEPTGVPLGKIPAGMPLTISFTGPTITNFVARFTLGFITNGT